MVVVVGPDRMVVVVVVAAPTYEIDNVKPVLPEAQLYSTTAAKSIALPIVTVVETLNAVAAVTAGNDTRVCPFDMIVPLVVPLSPFVKLPVSK